MTHIGQARLTVAEVGELQRRRDRARCVGGDKSRAAIGEIRVRGRRRHMLLRTGDRQCGAGVECNLVWLKLDPRWKVSDAKSVLYESCWLPVTSDEGPKVSGRTLLLEFDDLRDDTRHEVSYDAEEPEEGLTEKTRPMPKENP